MTTYNNASPFIMASIADLPPELRQERIALIDNYAEADDDTRDAAREAVDAFDLRHGID
jgi:hypothetical protein